MVVSPSFNGSDDDPEMATSSTSFGLYSVAIRYTKRQIKPIINIRRINPINFNAFFINTSHSYDKDIIKRSLSK